MKPTPAMIAAACYAMMAEHGEWMTRETPYESFAIPKVPSGVPTGPGPDELKLHRFASPEGAATFVRMRCMSAAIEAALKAAPVSPPASDAPSQ